MVTHNIRGEPVERNVDHFVATDNEREPPRIGRSKIDQRLLPRGAGYVLERRRGQELLVTRHRADLGYDLIEFTPGRADLLKPRIIHLCAPPLQLKPIG